MIEEPSNPTSSYHSSVNRSLEEQPEELKNDFSKLIQEETSSFATRTDLFVTPAIKAEIGQIGLVTITGVSTNAFSQ